jgi:hypothetical protein
MLRMSRIRATRVRRLQPIRTSSRVTAPADIQAALTVLGRRDQSHDDPTTRIDLRNTCLRNADLIGANLSGADLTGADYDERTSFIGAVIDEATTGLENALAGW